MRLQINRLFALIPSCLTGDIRATAGRSSLARALLAAAFFGAVPSAGAQDHARETLQKLADAAAGPSGFEKSARSLLVGMMKPLATNLIYETLARSSPRRAAACHGSGSTPTWINSAAWSGASPRTA